MHQIGSGMYVSGPAPDRRRERRLSAGSAATLAYTGGNPVRSGGELGRMFYIATLHTLSPASSRRSSGPLPRPSPSPASGPLSQLSHSGLLVGPSPSPSQAPSPGRGSSRKGSWRRGGAGKEAAAAESAGGSAARGRARLGVPLACYVLVAVAAAATLGAGAFCLVSWPPSARCSRRTRGGRAPRPSGSSGGSPTRCSTATGTYPSASSSRSPG